MNENVCSGGFSQPIEDVGYRQPPAEAVTTNEEVVFRGDTMHLRRTSK